MTSKPQTLYKLTNKNGQTYGGCQWGPNITHKTSGRGDLCGPGWLHAYTHPLLAVLLNPVHAAFNNPRLWEARGVVGKSDYGLKVGTTRLTTIREIPLPRVTSEQYAKFAILCAKEVCSDIKWNKWAENWLNGTNRSPSEAIRAAERVVGAAENAASASAWAAALSGVEGAAKRAAGEAAKRAAERAAQNESWGFRTRKAIDLIRLAEEACRDEKKHQS